MSETNDDLGLNFAGLSFEDLNPDQVGSDRLLHAVPPVPAQEANPPQKVDPSIPQQQHPPSAPAQKVDTLRIELLPPAPAQKVDVATLQQQHPPPPAPAPTHTFELTVQRRGGFFSLVNNPSTPNTTVYKLNKSMQEKMIINKGQGVQLTNSESQSIVFDGGSELASFLFHLPNFDFGFHLKTVDHQNNLLTSVAGLTDRTRNCHPTHCYWSNYTLVQVMD